MVLLPTAELNAIKVDIQNIVRDTSINTSIKYRQYTRASSDYGINAVTAQSWVTPAPYADTSGVSALKGLVTKTEVDSFGNIEIGDTKFVIMQSGVSNTLSNSDVIVESGTTYNIKGIDYDPLGIVYIIFCSRG